MYPSIDPTKLPFIQPALGFVMEHKYLICFLLGLFIATIILRPDPFQDLRVQIMKIRKRAINGANLQKIRMETQKMGYRIDEARRKEKISALDKEYLDNLLSQAMYLNMSAHS